MTGKSRRRRGRQPPRKAKSRQRATAMPTSQPGQAGAAAFRTQTPAPPVAAPREVTRPPTPQYPYISAELRTIGLLAALMLAILLALYFLLP